MNIVISGATGLIGQQLVSKIIQNYNNPKVLILGIDKLNSKNHNIINVKMNLLDFDLNELKNIFISFKPEIFFHLAWNTNHSDYLVSDENILWENSSKKLIDLFYESGGKKFIGIGSSIEYDWSHQSPMNEFKTPISNQYQYSISKLNVLKYLREKEKNFVWGRVFFVFGPNQSNTRLIPKIISNALNGKPDLSIVVDLERDYLSTFEIANQLIMLEKANCNGEFNICSGKPFKLGDFVDLVSKITNKKISIETNSYSGPLDSKTVYGSNDKFKKYYPYYDYSYQNLENDLIETIKTFND